MLSRMDEFLVWLLNGSIKYFKDGLGTMSEQIQKATNEYMNENDGTVET